jgi:hypothetical protein
MTWARMDRDLGRRTPAQVQADRRMDAPGQFAQPGRAQALQALFVGAPAAQRADVEQRLGSASSSAGSSSLGSCDSATSAVCRVEAEPRQRFVGPLVAQRTPGKRSGEAKAPRGSITMTSKPAVAAIGASAWAICTAPTISRRGDGT